MGWKTSFQPQSIGTIHREEPAQFRILVFCCSTYWWLRRLQKQKNLGSGEPFISSASSLQSIKKDYQLAWRKSQQRNQVQINARRRESFLPLSSLSSPDVKQPQLGRAWCWDQLCFSLIALHYMRLGGDCCQLGSTSTGPEGGPDPQPF